MKKIKLTNDQYTLVDNEDFEMLSKFKWRAESIGEKTYARGFPYGRPRIKVGNKIKRRPGTFMHRYLLKPAKGMVIDHKDNNGLNNQRENLRICSYSQNNMNSKISTRNTSGYKGVCWSKKSKKWLARIGVDKKYIIIGYFKTKELAYKARLAVVEKYHGEFARL